MDQLRYDGRVAVVTGAGNGLGKEYALLLSSRGAKVVVNDLGGARDGSGNSSNAADDVVKQIKDKGGVAVADYNSVVEGEKIIKTALDNFGRVDIIINNAGILRDKSFSKISDQDWELIMAVHLKGAFKTTQAAWEIFRKQKFGRVIMTGSNTGLLGNFGQANYGAAKLGLVGLANTLAIEGAKYNIKVNTIIPTAASRLTEDIMPKERLNTLDPSFIAPVVAYMVHETFEETGLIIDAASGYASKSHLVRGVGSVIRKKPSDPVSIESVKESWSKVTDMSKAEYITGMRHSQQNMSNVLQTFEQRSKIDGDAKSNWGTYSYSAKDVALYALGVGASTANPSDLKFLYEGHNGFVALPTFFTLVGISDKTITKSAMPPGKVANVNNILHGEQYIEFFGDYPGTEGSFTTRTYVADVLDKGSAAVVISNCDVYRDNLLVYRTQQHVFVVGQGGFGGPRTSTKAYDVAPAPKRAPDAVVEQKTAKDQAALYRLSGDLNPIHIDPDTAKASGQPEPILHGLGTLGIAARHVLIKYGGNDPANFKALKARFAKPVLCTQTLVTEMWVEGTRVHFQTKVKENGNVAIAGAYVDLKKVVVNSAAVVVSPAPVSSPAELKSDAVFTKIKDVITTNPALAKGIGGLFLYNIVDNGKSIKQWTLDLKTPAISEGTPKGKPDVTLSVSDSDLVDIASGALSAQTAFMKGKIKISGNIMLAQKLGPLLTSAAKL